MSRCLGTKSVGACLGVLPAPAPAPSARELLGLAHRHCRLHARAWSAEMDQHGKDSVVTRALALALMRQALTLLNAVGETAPAVHLQMAVDTMARAAASSREDGAGAA